MPPDIPCVLPLQLLYSGSSLSWDALPVPSLTYQMHSTYPLLLSLNTKYCLPCWVSDVISSIDINCLPCCSPELFLLQELQHQAAVIYFNGSVVCSLVNLNPDSITKPLENVCMSVLSSICIGYQEKDLSNVKLITRGSDGYCCRLGYKKHYSALRT